MQTTTLLPIFDTFRNIALKLQKCGVSLNTCIRIGDAIDNTWFGRLFQRAEPQFELVIDRDDIQQANRHLSAIAVGMLTMLRRAVESGQAGTPPIELLTSHGTELRNATDRWCVMLDEMIWAHQQIAYPLSNDTSQQPSAIIGMREIDEQVVDPVMGKLANCFIFDYDPQLMEQASQTQRLYEERIQNGLRLYGEYYRYLRY